MKFYYSILLSTIVWIFLGSFHLRAQTMPTYPEYEGFVNDYMNLLSITEKQQLETYLVKLAESTSNEIVVAILESPEFGDHRFYTSGLATDWKIGQESKDNGVLLAVFPEDRKIIIEVGYGLEGAIPDIAARNIISKDISPSFRDGNYFQGISQGVQALGTLATGEISEAQRKRYYAPPRSTHAYSDSQISLREIIIIMIIIYIIFSIIRRGNGGSGGYNRRGKYRGGGSWVFFPTSFGGGWGDSGGSGWGDSGGFGGGGFGGFGGGDFGGGGAMGDW